MEHGEGEQRGGYRGVYIAQQLALDVQSLFVQLNGFDEAFVLCVVDGQVV